MYNSVQKIFFWDLHPKQRYFRYSIYIYSVNLQQKICQQKMFIEWGSVALSSNDGDHLHWHFHLTKQTSSIFFKLGKIGIYVLQFTFSKQNCKKWKKKKSWGWLAFAFTFSYTIFSIYVLPFTFWNHLDTYLKSLGDQLNSHYCIYLYIMGLLT